MRPVGVEPVRTHPAVVPDDVEGRRLGLRPVAVTIRSVSDTIVYVIALDLSADEARKRRARIAEWLIGEGVFARNPARVGPRDSGEFVSGPRAEDRATNDWMSGPYLADLLCVRDTYTAMELFEPPPCAACGAHLDHDHHMGLLRAWEQGGEPTATCGFCAHSALLGDWEWEYGACVGELAVAFENWPELCDAFVDELGSRLGGRRRTIVSRY
jgi:hypothetical protein